MMNEWIISSSVLIGLVLLGRFLLRGKISLRLQYGLWAVALVRLLLPVQIFTSDFGAGSIARDVDISAPVRQVYVSANEDRYQREYDEAYRQVVARYESASEHVDPIVIEKEAAHLAEKAVELDLTQLLLSLWFAGMVVMTSVICSCNVHLALQLKRRRWALEVPDSLLPVYVTEAVPTPCIFGFFKPAIYLTPEAAKDGQVCAHVLEHELTHYRHLDHIWSVLRSLCLVLHWYNPLVWAAAKVSRADAELACDEGALARLGEEQRGDYGRTLIGLTCSAPISDLLLTATTMTGSAGSIRERIKLLMQRPRNTVLTLTAVILLVTLVVGCTFAGAPETTQPTETTTPGVDNDMSYQGQELPIPDDLTHTELSYALPMEQAIADYNHRNARKLTEAEIAQVKEAFASTVYDEAKDEYLVTPVAAFFTSDYDDVRELDFAEFLRYFPTSGEATEEEFQLLRQKYGEKFDFSEHETLQDMPVPVHRYAVSDIDAVIRRYANIPFQELQDKDSVYYLEETDSYYNFTSDFGPGMFSCVDGFVYDGGAILYSTSMALFLTESGGHYSITAHLPLTQTYSAAPISAVFAGDDLHAHHTYQAKETEYLTSIAFTATERLLDVEFGLLHLTETAGWQMEVLDSFPFLQPDHLFLAQVPFWGDTTTYGLRFTDAAGRDRRFAVSISGEDGSLVCTEYFPADLDLTDDSGILVFPGTEWGMTEEALLEALNIREYGTFSGMRGIYLSAATFCGYPAEMAFYFDQYRSTDEWGLTDVLVKFADAEATNAVYDILSEQLGGSDFWTSEVTFFAWHSDTKLADLVSPEAYAVYQDEHTFYIYEGQSEDLIAASAITWFGADDPEMKNTVCFSSRLHLARQIEASLTPEFGTAAYFDALLNPRMYRSEADWYPRALTSFYEDAGQIDLFQLFYGGIPGGDNSITDEERAFLESWPDYDPNFSLMRIPAAEMNRVLMEYFGVQLYGIEGIGLENFLYWEQTDCYYHCRSDSNLPFVEIVGCAELEDDLWNVTYTDWQDRLCVVSLVYSNGTWKVLSNTRAK